MHDLNSSLKFKEAKLELISRGQGARVVALTLLAQAIKIITSYLQ